MNDQELLGRIVLNPKVMVGKPVIKGTRLTVEHILRKLAYGVTREELFADYPGLTEEDIRACMLHAAVTMEDITYIPELEAAR